MRCSICDKTLSEKEVNWNTDLSTFEPCGQCMDIIMDAAYTSQFAPEEENHIVDASFDDETLYGDSGDIWSASWDDDYD
jgi:hypothetical protein